MLERIELRNFQSHKDTVIDLSDGLNVIVGATDSGKSAIIRALDWLMNNQPAGDEYRSSWGGDTMVTAVVDGHIVRRVRTNSKNYYEVDGSILTALGREVPKTVRQLLSMERINFAYQHDPPYMVYDSGGEVARAINKAAGLDISDALLQKLMAAKRRADADVDARRLTLRSCKERLAQYDAQLAAIEPCRIAVMDAWERHKATAEAVDKLRGKIAAIDDASERLRRLPKVGGYDDLKAAYKEWIATRRSLTDLKARIDLVKRTILDKNSADTELKERSREMDRIRPSTCPFQQEWREAGGVCRAQSTNM